MESSRAPPPQGPPPSYAFVTKVYRRSLRPVVIATAFLGGLWALFSGVGWFRNYNVDRNQGVAQIANLSLALGVLYMTIAVIGGFGMFAATSQRAPLVRIYALLAGFATLIVLGTGLARVVTHFIWKNDLIRECTTLTSNKQIVYYGFWGPISREDITPEEANKWCNDSWNHDSWAEIVSLLILLVLAGMFTIFAFGYHRQLLDPTSAANASRAPSSQARMGAFPTHYQPPYNPSYSGPGMPYAPPQHPPYAPAYNAGGYNGGGGYGYGGERDEGFVPPYDTKPPGYVGSGVHDDGKKGADPFADEERDVTSRPAPGGDESFGFGRR